MNTLQKTIIIILVVILIMGLIIGGFFLYQNKTFSKNDPNEVLLKYVEALSNKNYEKMYEYLTNESKKLISKEDFISRNKNIYEGIEASDIKISVTKVNKINNDKTQITYTTYMNTLAGKINFSNTVDFLKDENKKYYLNWSSKVIYPELEQDDKIRVNTIEAKRGQILDRNGVVLAGKGSASSVRISSWKDRK
ncbi:MAG: NTF2-like N-terminal transpeptidase domain-containing protein [Clostridia bacterium]